jgi:hypothetical protein
MHSVSTLKAVKERFGGLVSLDFTHTDLRSAHRMLGEHVHAQVHNILRQRLDQLDANQLDRLLDQTFACAETITDKLADQRIDSRIQAALQEYVDCLAAWAEGAGLSEFDHPALARRTRLCPIDLALFLQHDGAGCQTGMYRQLDGSIIMWHTEEDIEDEPGSGFDQLRLAAFDVGDEENPITMTAFIYPDLLPGPAFGWRSDGYTQAVDTLHVRASPDQKTGMLANITTWLTLRLGLDVDPARVITTMGPSFDGYALNTVSVRGGTPKAEKHEFAANRILSSILGEQPGSYLFQVNIFSQRKRAWVRQVEDLPAEYWRLYRRRTWFTRKAIQNKDHHEGGCSDMDFFFNLICSPSGIRWPYANPDMKAYYILHQTEQGAEIRLGYGPAMAGDQYSVIHIPGRST